MATLAHLALPTASDLLHSRKLRPSIGEDISGVASRLSAVVKWADATAWAIAWAELKDPYGIFVSERVTWKQSWRQRYRFLVAHELGHIALHSTTGLWPTRRDYWRHEALCDDFAGKLLVPTDWLQQQAEFCRVKSWADHHYFVSRVANLADVSYQVAAARIIELDDWRANYLRLQLVEPKVLKATLSTFGGQRELGMGSIIRSPVLMTELDSMAIGELKQGFWRFRLGPNLQLDHEGLVERKKSSWLFTLFPRKPKSGTEDALSSSAPANPAQQSFCF